MRERAPRARERTRAKATTEPRLTPKIFDFERASRQAGREPRPAGGTGAFDAPDQALSPSPDGRRTLANVRMALTFASEFYYAGKNCTDHVVGMMEHEFNDLNDRYRALMAAAAKGAAQGEMARGTFSPNAPTEH